MMAEAEGSLEHVNDEAFVIVKAAPRVSKTYGETVCIAAIDHNGCWVRLYPVSFQDLSDAQRFGRWDRITYRWRKPKASVDRRSESRRVDQGSIVVAGKMRVSDRHAFLNRAAVTSLKSEIKEGRSLAVLSCEVLEFWHEHQSAGEMQRQSSIYDAMRQQNNLFSQVQIIPREPCPFLFKYRYRDDDGVHIGTCQDWETEATFVKRRAEMHSEQAALDWMAQKFGVDFPREGMALAMGTHRYRADQWLINGVLRVNPTNQISMF